MFTRAETEPDLFKGLIAGVAGGLAASFFMEQFQALWAEMGRRWQSDEENSARKKRRQKPTTVKAADAVTERITGRKVPRQHQKLAGEAVHYAMGGVSGAVYGSLAEVAPLVKLGEGTAFGAAVWLAADEATLPALGLTKDPRKIPVATHVYALASHLVYGFVTEVVRRAVRSAL